MKLWRKPFDSESKTIEPGKVIISKDRCKGCSYCTEFCPRKSLKMSQEISSKGYLLATVDDPSKCLNCGLCEIICPDYAIHLTVENKRNQD
jgi:2-oxoglutarate ferredoxin oxidoreductase subunit delta